MKSDDILEAIGSVDDNCIKNAKEDQKSKKALWIKLSTIAACIAAIIIIPFVINFFNNYDDIGGSNEGTGNALSSSANENNVNNENDVNNENNVNNGNVENSVNNGFHLQENGFGNENSGSSIDEGTPNDTLLGYADIQIYFIDGNKISSESEYLPRVPSGIFNIWKEKNDIGDEVRFIEYEIDSNETYNLTISADIENYCDTTDSSLLLESLKKTMAGASGIEYDELNLIIK